MSEKANGQPASAGSFGERSRRRRDLPHRTEPSPWVYLALLLAIAGGVAVVVAWSVDGHFRVASSVADYNGVYVVGRPHPPHLTWSWTTTSLRDLVVDDVRWALCTASLSLAPFVFLWWRRSAAGFFRWIGCALSVVPGVVTLWLTRSPSDHIYDSGAPHWGPGALVFAAAAFTAAFLVAPAPRDPDEIDAVALWRIVRRHRKLPA